MTEEKAPEATPDPTFLTQIGWVTGKSPLSGWNYHVGLRQWLWFPEPEGERILVSEAGTREVCGVYTFVDKKFRMLGTDFYFDFSKKAGGFIMLAEGLSRRMYYVSRTTQYEEKTNPADVTYWMTERGQLPKIVVTRLDQNK